MITGDQNLGQAIRDRDQFTSETRTALTGASDTNYDTIPVKSLAGLALHVGLGDAEEASSTQSSPRGRHTEMPSTPRDECFVSHRLPGTSSKNYF